jgi:hypothetical protein
MVRAFRISQTKVELLLKNPHNHADLSITKMEFLKSSIEIKIPYLLVHTREEGPNHNEFSTATKVFHLNEISAYKVYNIITK